MNSKDGALPDLRKNRWAVENPGKIRVGEKRNKRSA